MANTLTPSELLPALHASLQGHDESMADAAGRTGMSETTVRAAFQRWEPVVGELRALRKDFWLGAWQWVAMHAFERINADGVTAKEFRDLSVAMGVATDKTLLLAGMPTQIIVGVHEHRLQLPELLDKMRDVSARLSASG